MALHFTDPPKMKRGSGATAKPVLTDAEIAELKENPGKWALVGEKVKNAQRYAQFKKENPAFTYTTRAREKNGKAETYKDSNGKDKNYLDVWVAFDPDRVFAPKKKKD